MQPFRGLIPIEHMKEVQRMHARRFGSVAALAIALTLLSGLLVGRGATLAQDGGMPHPAHIHAGTCDELGEVVFPLTDVSSDMSMGMTGTPADASADEDMEDMGDMASMTMVEVSMTTVDASLDDIIDGGHAINVHESADNIENYIACGDITGTAVDGQLVIALQELNGSGYVGVAHLEEEDDSTVVHVFLLSGMGGTGSTDGNMTEEATPVSEDESDTTVDTSETGVEVVDFVFRPETLEIAAGTTVTWTNQDIVPHTATADDGSFNSGKLSKSESFSFTFEEPGTYEYFCEFHPNMTGTIVVT